MNSVLENDFNLLDKDLDSSFLKEQKILITGSTGLIGSLLVKYFDHLNKINNYNIKMYLIVRNEEKAKKMLPKDNIKYIVGDIEKINKIDDVDYAIHLASPTKSKYFVTKPVETMNTIINGTNNILNIIKEMKIKKFIYASSMEMYGISNDEMTEDKLGYINNLDVRSSYSEGKRVSELYSYNYYKEYNVPVVIARLAMCFGSGILDNETRVYKYFIDQGRNNKDIVLKSTGETRLNYIYTLDAIKGLLILLKKGINGEAYNICDDIDNFTIKDMAEYIADHYHVNVIRDIDKNAGLAPDNKMKLNNEKIKKLGFKPTYNIYEAIDKTIEYIEKR